MRTRLFLLAAFTATFLWGTYKYDQNLDNFPESGFATLNGSAPATGGMPNVSFSTPGSYISAISVAGTPNDYEINTPITLGTGGGTYVHYLRASSDALASSGSCTGSYISVEIAVPGTYVAGGDQAAAAQLNINQCASGTLSGLSSVSLPVSNSANLRSVIWGTTLWVFINGHRVWMGAIPSTTGSPGFGGYGLTAPASFSWGYIGHHDTVAPSAPPATGFRSRSLPSQVSLAWQGAEDPDGIGVFGYSVSRNGVLLGIYEGAELSDSVSSATAYTYSVAAVDFHGNMGPATSYSLTTPAASTGDPRRTGVVPTGSYWGGGGEQIDLLSGNLNYSLPLLSITGRTGNKIPLSLSYNSQNWGQDSGSNWQLGSDTDYGFGWQVRLGSITPYYLPWPGGVDHYIFTDNSGAEYRLDQHAGSVWSSTQGIYVWFDADSNLLHFKDGSFWVMGAVSSGNEVDAGTLYPTILEDVNGNEIIVTYQVGYGLPSAAVNTSGRILVIQDAREVYAAPWPLTHYTSYDFTYDETTGHLMAITNYLGTSETYTFKYDTGVGLMPPFGTDPAYAGLTTTHLASIGIPGGGTYQFTYDSAGAAELTEVKFPWGGHLRWDYATAQYATSRSLREVSNRYLSADSGEATEWTYPITHSDTGTTIPTVHADTAVADASGNGSKAWTFVTNGPAWQIGLTSDFDQKTSVSGIPITHDEYTWSQTPSSNPYISMKVAYTDPTTSDSKKAKSTQTLDGYGNVTQSVIYPYDDLLNPLRTVDMEYVTDAGYVANYVRNRLLRTQLTLPDGTKETVEYYYDGKAFGYQTNPVCPVVHPAAALPAPPGGGPSGPTALFDPSPLPFNSRGLLNGTISSSASTCTEYYAWGVPALEFDPGTGETVSLTPSSNSAWSLPSAITTQTYSQNVSYNSWLGVTGTTGLNGETMSMTYDSSGRPASATSPYNTSGTPTITYAYSASGVLPVWQAKTGPDGYTKTTLDGLGRAIKVERGPNSTTIQSEVDTVYAPCACSPMAKLQKTSMPYAPGTPGAPFWTTYVYDGIGRTVSSTLPDGASTTNYVYAGNKTTVTDPAGKWKTYTNDVLGNLITVTEPDPANPTTAFFTTSYTYDWMNHLSTSTMTRGGTTQTRTFVYNDAGQLTSATNPENGTVTYTYNSDKTLYKKHDAKGQDIVYSYDSYRRLLGERHYRTIGGVYGEAVCERVTYTYDTNPYDPYFSSYAAGRLTTAQYGDNFLTPGNCYTNGYHGIQGAFLEMYAYHPAGGVTAKRVQMLRVPENDIAFDWYYPDGSATQYESGTVTLDVNYTYDAAGRRNSIAYPTVSALYDGMTFTPMQSSTFTTTYDAMGRPQQVSSSTGGVQAYSAQYDAADRMTSVTDTVLDITVGYPSVTKSMTYNVNGQLTSQSWTKYGGTAAGLGSLTYWYSGTQNNGQITQMTDGLSGETIVYQYDALKRLTSAAATPSGSTPAAWTQTYHTTGSGI